MRRACAVAFLGLTVCAGALAAADPAKTAADAFVGTWYVDPTRQDGILSDSLVTRNPDGTLAIAFRLCDHDKLLTYDEAGTWSVAGDVYRARTHIDRTIDGTPPDGAVYENEYRIERTSARQVSYRSTEGGDIFKARRVAPDFQPSPDLCSSETPRSGGR